MTVNSSFTVHLIIECTIYIIYSISIVVYEQLPQSTNNYLLVNCCAFITKN